LNDLISMAQQGELQVDVVLDLRQQRRATSGWNYFAGYSGSRRLYWQQNVHWNSFLLFVSNISSPGHMMGLIVNDDKVKYTDIAVRSLTCHTALMGTYVPYTITQCWNFVILHMFVCFFLNSLCKIYELIVFESNSQISFVSWHVLRRLRSKN